MSTSIKWTGFETSRISCEQDYILFLPPATKLGQSNVFTGVCDSVQGRGSASVHAGIPAPPSRHPWDQTGTPLDQVGTPTRPGRYPTTGTRQAPPRTRPSHPPGAEHAGRYGQCAGGMHPTGMQTWWILYSRGRVWVHHLSLSSGHRRNGILRWPSSLIPWFN